VISFAGELASLPLARAYIDTLRESIASLGASELTEALGQLDRAYREFPELLIDRSCGELIEALQSATKNMPDRTAIPVLMECLAWDPTRSSSVSLLLDRIARSDEGEWLWPALRLLRHCGAFCWETVRPILDSLRQQDRREMMLAIVSEALGSQSFASAQSFSHLGEVLAELLRDAPPLSENGESAVAKAAASARRRLPRPHLGRNAEGPAAAHLAMAERLRAVLSPSRLDPRPEVGWPSGRLSFDEFLVQWPCEVQLQPEADAAAFIEEAYRAILLRPPEPSEQEQYLRLLQTDQTSKSWILEDLLMSAEFRSLERCLRVIWNGQVFTEPGSTGEEAMFAFTLPPRPAS
jgi:hypothetical protein